MIRLLLSYVLSCSVLVTFILACSFFFWGNLTSPEVCSSYECGFEPLSSSHTPFCMKFFLLALLFIIFDVELSFLVPCLSTSILIFSFVLLLGLGLLFEFSFGGLDWVV